ncbi:MAG: hypothetical protein IJU84_00830 [Clostridia bacterium]|nr:hypothetical protein [Clostridia bacterium]
MKRAVCFFVVLCILSAFCACDADPFSGGDTGTSYSGGIEETPVNPTEGDIEDMIEPIVFDNLRSSADMPAFIAGTEKPNGEHDNDAKQEGAVISPYYDLSVGEISIPCYAVRTTYGAHTFACADILPEAFPVSVKIGYAYDIGAATVLPESSGVTVKKYGNEYYMQVADQGNYTFVPNGEKERALTLFLREKGGFSAPSGYDAVKIPAGRHNEKIEFGKEKRVLYFSKGEHVLKYGVEFLNDTAVYLENGAYIYAETPADDEEKTMEADWAGMPRWKALFEGNGVNNVKIYGRGAIDLSRLDWHARSAVRFDLSSDITVEGVTVNNAPEWTMYFTRSENILVKDILLFGYRQNSDGVCFADSANALCKNCFARSGDDLFEVKSMYGACDIEIKDIRFEKCNAWPDKARGLGIISESKRDMKNIYFIDCSVGYASADWMDALGGVAVILADDARVKDVYFENTEIYSSAKYPVNVTIEEGSRAVIEKVVFKNLDIRGQKEVRVANESAQGIIGSLVFDSCRRDGAPVNGYADLNLKLSNVNASVVSIK